MIGRRMSDKLLESQTLKFYQWEGDVKVSTSTYIYDNENIHHENYERHSILLIYCLRKELKNKDDIILIFLSFCIDFQYFTTYFSAYFLASFTPFSLTHSLPFSLPHRYY